MNNGQVMDLDKLLPEPVQVTLCGKLVKVIPGKLKTILKLQKAFKAFKTAEGMEQQIEAMEAVLDILQRIIPALKDDDDLDIGFDQIGSVVEVAFNSVVPQNQEEPSQIEQNGMKPILDEKKMVQESQEQSVIS